MTRVATYYHSESNFQNSVHIGGKLILYENNIPYELTVEGEKLVLRRRGREITDIISNERFDKSTVKLDI